jgi:hypothetical protein
MRITLALIGAPTVALADLILLYMLVPYACRWGTAAPLYGSSAAALALTAVATLLATQQWHTARRTYAADASARAARPSFIAFVAATVGGISTLVVLAMGFPAWLLSTCA